MRRLNWLAISGWCGTVTTLLGAQFVARQVDLVLGFGLFLLANAFLLPIQVAKRTWNQVVVQVLFAAIDIVGIHTALTKH